MRAPLKIATHDVPDAQAAVRAMRNAAHEVSQHYPGICGWRLALGHAGDAYQAHADVLLPQHQIIVNGTGESPERALQRAVAKLSLELAALAQRDRSVTYASPAKAA